MVNLFAFMTFVALLLFIVGSIGIVITFINFSIGDPHWFHGILTFGVFTVVGLATIVFLAMRSPEE
ncbi:MAG: hypothetical protein AMJ70_03110 [Dehalococcoidia bacterium SG8_51_3]|nr:MAG: hypothetical protein AMJ70_03110 [Dehalococcoidia bacterium SG8_51_3]